MKRTNIIKVVAVLMLFVTMIAATPAKVMAAKVVRKSGSPTRVQAILYPGTMTESEAKEQLVGIGRSIVAEFKVDSKNLPTENRPSSSYISEGKIFKIEEIDPAGKSSDGSWVRVTYTVSGDVLLSHFYGKVTVQFNF